MPRFAPPPPVSGDQTDSTIGGLVPSPYSVPAPEVEDVRNRFLGDRLGQTLAGKMNPREWQDQPRGWATGNAPTVMPAPALPAERVTLVGAAPSLNEWASYPTPTAETAGQQAGQYAPPPVPSYGPLSKTAPSAAAAGGGPATSPVVLYVLGALAVGGALYFATR